MHTYATESHCNLARKEEYRWGNVCRVQTACKYRPRARSTNQTRRIGKRNRMITRIDATERLCMLFYGTIEELE